MVDFNLPGDFLCLFRRFSNLNTAGQPTTSRQGLSFDHNGRSNFFCRLMHPRGTIGDHKTGDRYALLSEQTTSFKLVKFHFRWKEVYSNWRAASKDAALEKITGCVSGYGTRPS